jgi:hypothetical protein
MERLNQASSHYLEAMCARDFPWAVKFISMYGDDAAMKLSAKVKPSAFPKLEEVHFTLWKPAVDGEFFEHPLVKACKRLSTGDDQAVTQIPVNLLVPLLAKLPKLEFFEARSRAVRTKFTPTGEGTFDVELDVGAINPKTDDQFKKVLEAFKALDAKWVRALKLGERPDVPGYSQPNAESTKLAEAAVQHLPRA